jgi:hypothetical protein
MRNISELLREADPLRHESLQQESVPSSDQLDSRRQAVIAAASSAGTRAWVGSRRRMAVLAAVVFVLMAASFLGTRVWSLFVGDLQAAVRFEVRLAEDTPGPGLREAKVAGSGRSVYLHDEVIVTNSDIAVTRVMQGPGRSEYAVGIEFNASGAGKMRAATGNHIGKPVVILLDGQVVMAPTLRSPIGASARITGNFTRSQAERIVKGIEMR